MNLISFIAENALFIAPVFVAACSLTLLTRRLIKQCLADQREPSFGEMVFLGLVATVYVFVATNAAVSLRDDRWLKTFGDILDESVR
jgi:hypothetical protein